MDGQIKQKFDSLPDEAPNIGEANFGAFLDRIGRADIGGQLTESTPWAYFSQEVYREKHLGVKGDGGLGVLAGDITRIAEQLGMPLVVVTPYYSGRSRQALFDFWENDGYETLNPSDHGLEKLGTINIKSKTYNAIPIDIYARRRGSLRMLGLYEPNIGLLYFSESNSDHRLYQEVVSGFAGYRAIRAVGLEPVVVHMNEAATVFSAIAHLDDTLDQVNDFDEALEQVKAMTIYTNHTLLQAAEGEFSIEQFESLVFPNIQNTVAIDWVRAKFTNNKLRLSTLALEIAGKRNGVSKLHSRLSSENYKNHDGQAMTFDSVTNGIANHWISTELLQIYDEGQIFDKFGLTTDFYKNSVEDIDFQSVHDAKKSARRRANQILDNRQDQYGNPIHIPEDAILFDYKRRLVSYKRVSMIFENPDKLASILDSNNAHLIFAGRPHFGDKSMEEQLHDILTVIDNNSSLKERVHYIQNYDEEAGLAMDIGGDCAINVPIVGQEACGTSWMKDIANCKLLISTTDGGVADVSPATYLEVSGQSYDEEVISLYERMEEACVILKNDALLWPKIISQLQAYLPTISGPRMIRDYLNLRF